MSRTDPGIERSEINHGQGRIKYQIHRSPRRKTVSVAVDPDLGVLLTAPTGVSVTQLDGIVRRKAGWIRERLRRLSEARGTKEFVSGESFSYLGRQYRLRVRRNGRRPVKLDRGWLTVGIASGEGALEVRGLLVEWYRGHAQDRLTERVALLALKVGVEVPEILIREPRKRWGSCDSAGRLRFNWRIIQAPMRLVDYVVAHELVHLLEKNHTRRFWQLLGRAMPDYDARRQRLGPVGSEVGW